MSGNSNLDSCQVWGQRIKSNRWKVTSKIRRVKHPIKTGRGNSQHVGSSLHSSLLPQSANTQEACTLSYLPGNCTDFPRTVPSGHSAYTVPSSQWMVSTTSLHAHMSCEQLMFSTTHWWLLLAKKLWALQFLLPSGRASEVEVLGILYPGLPWLLMVWPSSQSCHLLSGPLF